VLPVFPWSMQHKYRFLHLIFGGQMFPMSHCTIGPIVYTVCSTAMSFCVWCLYAPPGHIVFCQFVWVFTKWLIVLFMNTIYDIGVCAILLNWTIMGCGKWFLFPSLCLGQNICLYSYMWSNLAPTLCCFLIWKYHIGHDCTVYIN
jgi:hypothetical protein